MTRPPISLFVLAVVAAFGLAITIAILHTFGAPPVVTVQRGYRERAWQCTTARG